MSRRTEAVRPRSIIGLSIPHCMSGKEFTGRAFEAGMIRLVKRIGRSGPATQGYYEYRYWDASGSEKEPVLIMIPEWVLEWYRKGYSDGYERCDKFYRECDEEARAHSDPDQMELFGCEENS